MPVAGIQTRGSPLTPRCNSSNTVERIGGRQPSHAERSPAKAASLSKHIGSGTRSHQAAPSQVRKPATTSPTVLGRGFISSQIAA